MHKSQIIFHNSADATSTRRITKRRLASLPVSRSATLLFTVAVLAAAVGCFRRGDAALLLQQQKQAVAAAMPATACNAPVNVTLDARSVAELVGRLQDKMRAVTTGDTESRLYYPLVAGFVRLAFHACAAAERCGSRLDFADPANNGLRQVVNILDDLWQSMQSRDSAWRGVSKADLYALAGVAAVEVATDRRRSVVFRYGRSDHCGGDGSGSDADADDEGEGGGDRPSELPHRGGGTKQTLRYFRRKFGFAAHETVAIMGAHSLGVVNDVGTLRPVARWTNGDPGKLSNEYYKRMINDGPWRQAPGPYGAGAPHALWEWRPQRRQHQQQQQQQPSGGSGGGGGARVMLNCDIGLLKNVDVLNTYSGAAACTDTDQCSDAPPEAVAAVHAFADDEELFLDEFVSAFGKMIENGWAGRLKDVVVS